MQREYTKDFRDMTLEQIVVEICRHMKEQGQPAMQSAAPKGVAKCSYRTADGLACAVGCLIPDAVYASYTTPAGNSLEGNGARVVIRSICDTLEDQQPHYFKQWVMSAAQGAHDTLGRAGSHPDFYPRFLKFFKSNLLEFADKDEKALTQELCALIDQQA